MQEYSNKKWSERYIKKRKILEVIEEFKEKYG